MSDGNGNGKNRALRLADAREKTPPVDPGEALRLDLRGAFFSELGTEGAAELARKLKEQALAGDHKAMQLLTQLLLAPPAQPRVGPVIVNPGKKKRRKNVEAIPVEGKLVSRDEVPETLREDCAQLIRLEGPMLANILANRCGVTAYVVTTMMEEDDWFEMDAVDRKWHLSTKAYVQLNADRE